jgi:hypothetical protein
MPELDEILNMDLLQEQTDIIEFQLLQAGGTLALLAMSGSPSAKEVSVCLGKAIKALLKVKFCLDLDTNLSEAQGGNQ